MMWKTHFAQLFNVETNTQNRESVADSITRIADRHHIVSSDIATTIKLIKCGKSPGNDSILAKHFIFASTSWL